MSLRSFFTEAWNHLLGGSWSGGESYLFKSYSQAVTVGWAYVEEHSGWRYVSGGKEGAMARLQQALAGPDLLGALQAQIGPPTVFVNMYATPKGFDVDEYLTGLRSALIANGFSNDLVVERSSISGRLKAWWNNSPTATVTIKNFRLGQDELESGGYSRMNDPHSIIIYNGLSETGAGKSVPMWKYINATLHEIGHALFGFNHDSRGMTSDPSSIMDYRSAYIQGAGFNKTQQFIIMQSKWGKT
jgi:hypothetical protein